MVILPFLAIYKSRGYMTISGGFPRKERITLAGLITNAYLNHQVMFHLEKPVFLGKTSQA